MSIDKKFIFPAICICLVQFVIAQTTEFSVSAVPPAHDTENQIVEPFLDYANTIKSEDLRKHLEIIASDAYEGRETGKAGQKKAAEYIADYFELLGLPKIIDGGYFQEFPLFSRGWDDVYIKAGGNTFNFLEDFYCYKGSNMSAEFELDELVFLGYGIDDEKYSNYEGVDVKGKGILIFTGEPKDSEGNNILSGSEDRSDWSTNWRKKLKTAHEKGVKLVIAIDKNAAERMTSGSFKFFMKQESVGLEEAGGEKQYANSVYASEEMAAVILGKKKKSIYKNHKKNSENGIPYSYSIPGPVKVMMKKKSDSFITENILGYFEGTDMKDEVVVLTAHYDHVGKSEDGIFNGADDDGSGTCALLEIAEALHLAAKQGIKPRRSILVMLVSGEEKGLLGSDYYTQNPIFPLEKTYSNLNVDMIGRVDEFNEDDREYVYIIGSDYLSTDLHKLSEKTAASYSDIRLDYRYNDINDPNRFYYRSDHYNFAKNNIPVIFYFNGSHDDYHQTSDTVDKIEFDLLEKRTRLIFYTLWKLADNQGVLELDKL